MRKLYRLLNWLFSKNNQRCKQHQMKGKDLIFISCIKRDGSGTTDVSKDTMTFVQNERFCITCLSITQGTYIASNFNSYVVKIKE